MFARRVGIPADKNLGRVFACGHGKHKRNVHINIPVQNAVHTEFAVIQRYYYSRLLRRKACAVERDNIEFFHIIHAVEKRCVKLAVDYFIFTQMRGLAVRFPHCRHAVARNVKVVAVGVGVNAFQAVKLVHFFAVVTESTDNIFARFNVYELIIEAVFRGNRIAFHICEGNAEMNRTVGVNENIERFALGIVICNCQCGSFDAVVVYISPSGSFGVRNRVSF